MKRSEILISLVLLGASAGFDCRPASAQQSAASVLMERATALDAQGRHDLAAEDWRQVLLIDPRQPQALSALAAYYQSQGDAARADQYRRLLAGAPAGAPQKTVPSQANDALLERAAQLASQHKTAEAIGVYRQAFGSTQPSGPWAIAYYQTEASDPAALPDAIQGLKRLMGKYPQDPSYQLALGKILTYKPSTRLEGAKILAQLQGSAAQMTEAREAWRQAILWDPASPTAHETGPEYLRRFPDAELAAQLQAGAAKTATVKAPTQSPLEGEAYKALARGDLEGAQKRFESLLKLPGQAAKAEAGLGYVSMRQEQFDAAVEHFEKAVAGGVRSSPVEKALAEARYWRATAEGNRALEQGNLEKAKMSFDQALQIAPKRPEAVQGLARAMLARQQPAEAAKLFAQAVHADPQNIQGWIDWLAALQAAGEFQAVLDQEQHIPAATLSQLESRIDYLAILYASERSTGGEDRAAKLLAQIQAASSRATPKMADAQLRAAGVLINQHQYDLAGQLLTDLVRVDRKNGEAWKSLVIAEHLDGDDVSAIGAAERMPEAIYTGAMQDPQFLLTLAGIYQNRQQYDRALQLFNRARAQAPASTLNSAQFQLQMASLHLAMGDPEQAYLAYRKLAAEQPGQWSAWTGMISALHAGRHDAEALAVVSRLPEETASRLETEPGYLQILASVYSGAGQPKQAIDALRKAAAIYSQTGQPFPVDLQLQYAWLLMSVGSQQELGSLLSRLSEQPGLSAEQKAGLEKLWVTWSVKRADAELAAHRGKRAVAILELVGEMYPEDAVSRRALGSMYVQTGNPAAALKIYQQLDWQHASLEDYQGAIEAATAANQPKLAHQWLDEALAVAPNDAKLLTLGARLEEQQGNIRKAEEYLSAAGGDADQDSVALEQKTQTSTEPSFPEQQLTALLAGPRLSTSVKTPVASSASFASDASKAAPEAAPQASRLKALGEPLRTEPIESSRARDHDSTSRAVISTDDLPPWPGKIATKAAPSHVQQETDQPAESLSQATTSLRRMRFADEAPAPVARLQEIAFNREPAVESNGGEESATPDPLSTTPLRSIDASPVVSTAAQQTAAEELAALKSRYGPWVGGIGMEEGHSGTAGFDHLQRLEADTEASEMVGGSARLTVVTRAVMLDSGTPQAGSNYRFGSGGALPTNDQFDSGFGGELQIATRSFQASAGYTPANFLVANFIGRMSLRPAGGPFTISGYREPVKDSLLSYAGMRDPATGEVWGGVVASGGSINFSHGNADSGFYASLLGEELTGRNVSSNTRFAGGGGAYWRVYTNPYGSLKLGVNLTGMHYAQNQRYFTIGQGGYFSPDAFLLMNAPVSWESRPQHGFVYIVEGSLGIQAYQDSIAQSGSLLAGNGQISSTGASYDFHTRGSYHLSPHWVLEAFLEANNARQYQDVAGGFAVRYFTRPQPAELGPSGMIDVKQIRPLQIP